MKSAESFSATAAFMREALRRYVPVIRSWTTPDGQLPDPYETVYSENYAPANAAAVLASVCRSERTEEAAGLLEVMLARTVELLGDKPGVTPFCRVFLYHYGLMALLLAPEQDRSRLIRRFGPALASYEDDCVVVNTNCAALQWAMELFADALGLRPASRDLLEHRLAFIAKAQLESGFINDEVTEEHNHDGMPIAYHAFTLFLLMSAMAVIDNWPDRYDAYRRDAERIIRQGMSWLRHTVTPDGAFAMVERSGYQMFTWGALVSLLAYTAPDGEYGASVADAFRNWLPYIREDGTYGCTPNHLPHTLRVGFETYTHLNMYNLLGLTGIAVAERVLERQLRLPESEQRESVSQDAFVDAGSGYAFYRNGTHFFGCTMRMHNRKYAPAMQGFHFRLDGYPLPIAEPRLPGLHETAERHIRDGVWEGYVVTDEAGVSHFPNTMENIELTPASDGLAMVFENELLRCDKTIAVTGCGITWSYVLKAKKPLRSCRHFIPLVVYDGRNTLQIGTGGDGKLLLQYAGKSYTLECGEAVALDMDLSRSLLSVSGVSAQVRAVIAGPLGAGQTVSWTTVLRPIQP
ncbi:hypothetical protein FE783_09540 [Paenibacillus mesophilus]|uniref:hypothetical protein n=1 Tax=Paenibacillus mesophilus TaxID=2582849 RepID=UPI00110DF779|nr:hypothetical protein [Paenibacillus mesophilus]TMV50896.1 hypothetical protein FE783_09540 [Paenibacillus mesophilus]